jgi:pimeloyl-ACP methyl ester carboxylesterase
MLDRREVRGVVMTAARRILAGCFALALTFAPGAGGAGATERWRTLPEPPPMPEAVRSGTAPVNGIQMYYAVYGAGPPILMIHGGLGYAEIWSNQVADLSRDHTVIVADSRGHGRSTRTAAPFGYDLMASDYLALLDHLGIRKVALVGWSDGGIIGLDIAMHHPERLTKLFAQAANTRASGVKPDVLENPTFAAYVARAGAVYRRISPTPDQYDDFVRQISAMWNSQPNWSDEDLKKITVPTAIVLGDHDEAITRGHTEYMARTIPGAKLIILKNASHFAMLQDPAGYTRAIRAFLAE